LAEEIFHKPVRLGAPQNINGLIDIVRTPIHATGVGLLVYAAKCRQKHGGLLDGGATSIWERMKRWFVKNL
ncbi:MAG: cell division protein FtsA, partial [Gammaproteobacteria bacterium]|nr:cell division protein FtsA [Gammaproteobacteria bacterium]